MTSLPADHPARRHGLRFSSPAQRSSAGLPLANGLLGATIWGDAHHVLISLDRTDIWDLSPVPEFSGPDYTKDQLRTWVEAGDSAAIAARFEAPYKRPSPTKLPLGRIQIDALGEPCELDLTLAEVHVTTSTSSLTMGIDAVRELGWIAADQDLPALQVVPPRFGHAPGPPPSGPLAGISVGGPEDLGYEPPELIESAGKSGYVQTLPDGRGFCVLLHANQTIAYWTIALAEDPATARTRAEATLAAAHAADFGANRAAHRAWWAAEWQRAWLCVPDADIERQWTLDAYKLIAAGRSGVPPIALQGPWTGDDGRLPPWKGDYHHDLNTQMTYWPTLTGNRPDAHRGFLEWLWQTREACREWTAGFFGCAGLNVPMTADLLNRQIGGWAPYTHSASTSAWLAAHFVREADLSGDAAFLRERAAPYVFGVCAFIEAITANRGADGKRCLVLSSSPEINNNALNAWFEGWTNYDLALFRCTLANASRLARTLGDAEQSQHWEATLAELPQLARDEDGGLSVAPGHALEESHRHFSHVLAFHPLGLLSADDPAFAPSLARLERLGTRNWMGYSFAWMAGLYALAGDGGACVDKLRQFARGFTDTNSFHTNGEVGGEGLTAWPFNAFTLEGNCAAMAATQDMLLQNGAGITEVFPALPRDWAAVRFEHFRTFGGVGVSARYDAPRLVLVFEGPPHADVRLRLGRRARVEAVTLGPDGMARLERDWQPSP